MTVINVKYSFEDAMTDPGDVFKRPADVLASTFSDEEKRKILQSWEDLLVLRQTATAEGMGKAGDDNTGPALQEVANALKQLDG